MVREPTSGGTILSMIDTATPASPSSNGRAPGDNLGVGGDVDNGESPARRAIRIVATTVALVLAAGIFAYSCSKGETSPESTAHPAIVAQFPAPGGRALRQTDVGAELALGYDGRLTVNGIDIPEEDMEGAVDPDSLTEAELRQYGVRPTSRNRVFFRPGPGKVIEEFEPGEVTIVLRYFKDSRADTTTRVVTWTVHVI
jgi:hypothetical protein